MAAGRIFRSFVGATAAAALAFAGPASAQSSRATAQQQHAQILEAYGGAYDGPQAAYVARVGQRMAAAAGRPGQCTFSVVNSDVVNAFATPGCYIYVTRGLLGLINSEAELASVLGHEVGHVAARHAERRQSRSIWSTLGAAILGAVTGSDLLAQVAGQAAQLHTLSFSRAQEFEADTLAVRYLAQTGYSPYGLVEMLDALQREDQLEARTRDKQAKTTPPWARTHPLTGERINRALQEARRIGGPPGIDRRDAETYLAAVDGMIWGDDPAQGYVEGRTFAHPELRIAFDAPAGFTLANSPSAVKIQGPGDLRAEFRAGRMERGGLEDYAYGVLQQLAGRTPMEVYQPRRTTINGLEAVIMQGAARTQSGVMEARVAAYDLGGGRAYHFVTVSPAGRGGAFDPLFGSFRRISASEAARLRPRRIQVVTVRPSDTAQALAQRMAVEDLRLERFALINDLQPGEPLTPGRKVKLILVSDR